MDGSWQYDVLGSAAGLATTLYQHGDRMVADAFVATRLPCTDSGEARTGILSMHNLGAVPGEMLDEDTISELINRATIRPC